VAFLSLLGVLVFFEEHGVGVSGDSLLSFSLVGGFDLFGACCVAIFLGGGDHVVFMEEVVEHCVVGETSVIFVEMNRVDAAIEAVPSPTVCVLDAHLVWPCDFEWQFFTLTVMLDLCTLTTTP